MKRIIRPNPPPRAQQPRVSVVVPCYNYGHFLGACVQSVLSQPAIDVDILIIDDASTDGSGDVARALASTDRRTRVICHSRNQGHIWTYNEGLDQVEGDYSVLLSADDLLTPGSLARAVALMEANPSVGLAYGHPLVFWDEEIPRAREGVRSWSIWAGPEWITSQCKRGRNCIYSPEAVVRTSVQRQIGGYRAELPHSGDLEMWLRIASISDVGRVNGADQAYRRMHPVSMMQRFFSGGLIDLRERLNAYEVFFAAEGADIPGAKRALRYARRQLATESLYLAIAIVSSGAPRDESPDEYVTFASKACPDVSRLRSWREYQWWQNGVPHRQLSRPRRVAYDVHRDLVSRLQWWRWYLRGV